MSTLSTPLILNLFSSVLRHVKIEQMAWHEAVAVLWSVVVMRYHDPAIEKEVALVWKDCDAQTTELMMKRRAEQLMTKGGILTDHVSQ